MPQFDDYPDISSQEYSNFVDIPEYHNYYEEFPTVYYENVYDDPREEEKHKSSGISTSVSASAVMLGAIGGRAEESSDRGSSAGSSRKSAASLFAVTFIALVAVAGFVIPALDNAELSVDMDVDYGGDTLTYMVSLTNASANSKYYVVVMEDQTIVYEKEITDGYLTDTVQGLDSTKEHRVEVRSGLVPLYVVDSTTIPGQVTPPSKVDSDLVFAAAEGLTYTDIGTGELIVKTAGNDQQVIQYSLDGNTWDTAVPKASALGAFTVYFKADESDNYNALEVGSVSGTVSKATVVWPTIDSKIYNGNPQTADVPVDARYTVTANAGGTNAGSYAVTLTLTDDTFVNYKWADVDTQTKEVDNAFEISKADAVITQVPTACTDMEYDGYPYTLVDLGEATGGEMQYRVDDGDYSAEEPEGTNAGTYYVYYRVVGDANHNDIAEAGPIAATIDKAEPEYEVEGKILLYSGSSQSLVNVIRIDGGTLWYYITTAQVASQAALEAVPEGDWSASSERTDRATYYMYYKVVGDSNHNSTGPLLANMVASSIGDISYGLDDDSVKYYPTVVFTQDPGEPVVCTFTVYVNGVLDPATPVTMYEVDSTHYRYAEVEGTGYEIPASGGSLRLVITVYIGGVEQLPYEEVHDWI